MTTLQQSTQLTYSEVKSIYSEVEEIEDSIDQREVVENMSSEESDFEVGNYRFIHNDSIDKIQQEELEGDTYMLGCFSAWFLADILDMPLDMVELVQENEGFEGLGQMVLDNNKLEELQDKYNSTDGYGHHFNHYDGNEWYVNSYHVFRTN